jgi:hypothetical protein
MTELTLKTFFCDDPSSPIYGRCEADVARKALDAAVGAVPPAARTAMTDCVQGAIDEVFQIGLADVLGGAWKKLDAVRDGLALTRLDAGKVVLVPLLEHKITSKHEPHIDLMLGPKSVGRLAFEIALTLSLKGVELDLREGRIAGLKAGYCKGQGVFSIKDQELIKKDTKAFALPLTMVFAEPTAAT